MKLEAVVLDQFSASNGRQMSGAENIGVHFELPVACSCSRAALADDVPSQKF